MQKPQNYSADIKCKKEEQTAEEVDSMVFDTLSWEAIKFRDHMHSGRGQAFREMRAYELLKVVHAGKKLLPFLPDRLSDIEAWVPLDHRALGVPDTDEDNSKDVPEDVLKRLYKDDADYLASINSGVVLGEQSS
ncbi:hypothetical protein V865_002993 [Kwoniella europaea PYCC6329]|uniref:Uncharacterized protein n=1 Tax=Kwoniella europaea PYCC6329 TaxID=1423913 RepID=A0AAX4KEK0_9TREE